MKDKLYHQWLTSKPEDLSVQLYEAVEVDYRPFWAGKILAVCCELIPPVPELEEAIAITQDNTKWNEAYFSFRKIRRLRRKLNEDPAYTQMQDRILDLAENVMKVTYNATNPQALFDRDAGYWLVGVLQKITVNIDDSEFKLKIWNIVCIPRHM